MNEGRTTAIFAAVAAVTLSLAFWTKPSAITTELDESKKQTNQVLFTSFEDPDQAASLQIVKYDESLGQLETFEIAKDKSGLWKIPSHDDYPADAAEQVRDATTPLIGLKALAGVTTNRGDHSYYGVINPDDEKLKIGESGVGMLVRVKDASDKVLADLIIGKADKGENQRFVRVPSQDAVYVAELSTAPFSTEFRKWIKGELLGVKSFDINSIKLRDYAILPTQGGKYGMSKNFDADLAFDPAKNLWNLASMTSYDSGQAAPVEIGPTQELKAASLNDLRTAVQSLEIVSVRRKPKGLAADLKADKSLMESEESLKSLYSQGFFPQEGPNGPEIYATGGETIVGTQDGVEYLLRFGEAVAKLSGSDNTEKSEDGEENIGSLRRYLLVTARLDESKFPLPDIEPLPETIEDLLKLENPTPATPPAPPAEQPAATEEPPAPAAPTGDKPAEDKASEDKPAEDKPVGENPAEDKPAEEKPADAPATAEEAPAPEQPAEPTATEAEVKDPAVNEEPTEPSNPEPSNPEPSNPEPSNPEPSNPEPSDQCGPLQEDDPVDTPAQETTPAAEVKPAEQEAAPIQEGESAKPAEKAADAQPAVATPAEQPAAEQPPAAEKPAAEKPAVEKPADSEEELKERLEAARERIAKENQRKIDARNEKIAAARKKVQELNARFSDWYYLVSDSAYKKLKIARDQLIVEKGSSPEAPPTGFPGGGAFPNFPSGQ